MNCKKPVLDDHLAFLSVKHNVYLAELFAAIVLARKTGKASCEELKIEYRGSVNNEAIILITKEEKVIVQFRAPEALLLRENIAFENWVDTEKIRRQVDRQNIASNIPRQIQDLRHGMKKVIVEAEVIEVAKQVIVHTQYGNNVTLTNAWIEDETGKIKLCLWNEQADSIKLGDSIRIANGNVTTFKNERQLRIGKKGTISVIEKVISKLKNGPAGKNRNMLYA